MGNIKGKTKIHDGYHYSTVAAADAATGGGVANLIIIIIIYFLQILRMSTVSLWKSIYFYHWLGAFKNYSCDEMQYTHIYDQFIFGLLKKKRKNPSFVLLWWW